MRKIFIFIVISIIIFNSSVWGKSKKKEEIKTTEDNIIELISNSDVNGLNKEIKNNPYFMFEPIKEAYKNKTLDSKQKNAYEFVELCYEFSDMPLLQAVFLKDLDKVKANTRFNKDINKVHPQYGSALDIANILEDSAIKKEIISILKNSGAKLSSEIKTEAPKEQIVKSNVSTEKKSLNNVKETEKVEKKTNKINPNFLDNLDGYQLKTKITVTSKMKQKKDPVSKYFTLDCNGYKLIIQTTYADDIFSISKVFSFHSMKDAKKKMLQETERIEEKYGLQAFSEERTKKRWLSKKLQCIFF